MAFGGFNPPALRHQAAFGALPKKDLNQGPAIDSLLGPERLCLALRNPPHMLLRVVAMVLAHSTSLLAADGGTGAPPPLYAIAWEPPVLVGQSTGVAINSSCGAGRFWSVQTPGTAP